MAQVADALAAASFVGLAVVLPGVAVLRLLRVRLEPALVLPTGLVACAATALLAAGTGRPELFPVVLLVADLALVVVARPRPRAGAVAEAMRRASSAAVPVAAVLVLLVATRWGSNRTLPSGDFAVDSLNWRDTAFHVGLIRELAHAFPPQVPGLAGVPLSYHFGLDFVDAAALRFAGVDPYDALTRFDPLVWTTALVLALRAAATLLGGGRTAMAVAGISILAGNFGLLWAGSPFPRYWIDKLHGNILLAVVGANSVVPALAVVLAVVLAIARRAEGGGRGYAVLAALLAFALPGLKVFPAAHLALALGVALLLARDKRAVLPPLLAVGAALVAVLLAEGEGRMAVRLNPLLIVAPAPRWLAPLPGALEVAVWLPLWLCAALGLRLVGLPRALEALRSRRTGPVALATMALSGWLIGLLFDVSPRDRLPTERLFNEAGYFVDQSGALLWIFAALGLAGLARRHGLRVLAVAALLAFPPALQFVFHHRAQSPIVVPAAVLEAMRALERDSRPGDVVLQRPHPRWPPPPVVFAGRRVPLTRIYPYLSQFLPPAETLDRQQRLRRFFAATDPGEALLVARSFGATHAVAYEDDTMAGGARAILVPVFEDAAARLYRIRY